MKKVTLAILVSLTTLLTGGVSAQTNPAYSGWDNTSTGVRYSTDPAVIQSVEQKAAALRARGTGQSIDQSSDKTAGERISSERVHGKNKQQCASKKCVHKCASHKACHSRHQAKAAKKAKP